MMMEDALAAELEDGELSDVEYTPLSRPTSGLSNLVNKSQVSARPTENPALTLDYNSDDDDQESTESDDSDGPKLPKAPRMRLNLLPVKGSLPKKYNIWSQDLQDEALNEKLLNCDVDKSNTYDKSRNVESYNYIPLGHSLYEQGEDEGERGVSPCEQSSSNKRRYKDRRNVKRRLGPRASSPGDDIKGPSRLIYALKVTDVDPPEDIAADIANKLYEQKESLILKTIQTIGAQKAIGLFTKTKNIEEDGGMMILNGGRRRTPGGVYLYLLRSDNDITLEQKDAIFGEESKANTIRRRTDRARQRRENTKNKMEALKREGLIEAKLPALLTRAELVVKQLQDGTDQSTMVTEDSDSMCKEGEESDGTEKCGEESVSNPPPSPATDNRENSSDGVPEVGERKVLSYDDDFLDIGTDDMDVF